ncbi:MAG TPA: GNAT family N-acetyltransferase [Candidatus Enterenecus merdae]|nr:GNAT family N-acetyltransferase [Candidatus Enterenecus merdae]
MELIVKPFEALTPRQLYEILRLRVDVFVVEQQCPYPELDGKDPAALHLFLQDASGIHAYLRLLPPGLAFETASLGRVVSRARGLGLGDRILRAGIQKARTLGYPALTIEAQRYAKGFYARAGFRQIGAEFLEDGIPHVPMRLELAALGASCRKE